MATLIWRETMARFDPEAMTVTAVDVFGRYAVIPVVSDTSTLMFPVQCTHCGKIYDAADVHVLVRHADCSVWRSPCCDKLVDDRVGKSFPDIREIRLVS